MRKGPEIEDERELLQNLSEKEDEKLKSANTLFFLHPICVYSPLPLPPLIDNEMDLGKRKKGVGGPEKKREKRIKERNEDKNKMKKVTAERKQGRLFRPKN